MYADSVAGDPLATIRGEYHEMPELRLTAAQARCLFNLAPELCNACLNSRFWRAFCGDHRTANTAVPRRCATVVVFDRARPLHNRVTGGVAGARVSRTPAALEPTWICAKEPSRMVGSSYVS